MKEKYIELMERTLSAYSMEHIDGYFERVKRDGLTEHGFARLASNIGILIAHGRRLDLLPRFLLMMEFCCKNIPTSVAANDFAVREIIGCISEVEQSGAVDAETISRWKSYLATIDPYTCYDIFERFHEKNWALFTCVSELSRQNMGLCDAIEFIDGQFEGQFVWFDENGMYQDGKGEIHHHINYDLVPRGLMVLLLDKGYRGRYYNQIDDILKRSALLTLKMQSPNGEIAFGGRSNQFLYNEAWMMVIFEYEARRYWNEGNLELAARFKAAIKRAIAITEYWLGLSPIRHIKNRFPTETKFGCEDYAYFDKYMITAASNLHDAYSVCDDSIPGVIEKDHTPTIFSTTEHFHKLFLKAGGYGIEFDLNADSHYDACGLGRVQREYAPSTICMSLPCPADPLYTVDIAEPIALSFAPGIMRDGEWKFANTPDTVYNITTKECGDEHASATLTADFGGGDIAKAKYTVSESGVLIEVYRDDAVAYTLPAFLFDGEKYTDISEGERSLTIRYNGWMCRYTSSAPIEDSGRIAANRNGHYKEFITTNEGSLRISIEILRE